MHPYVAESRNRVVLYILLAGFSIALTWIFQAAIRALAWNFPWWIETPSILGIFGMLWKAYDKWMWDWRLSRAFGWTDVPNISGKWSARVDFERSGRRQSAFGTATIHQTSSCLSVLIRWDASRSHSVSGVMRIGEAGTPELIYQYVNQPSAGALDTMYIHKGTAWLEVIRSCQIVGEYYSGRGRNQSGSLTLQRINTRDPIAA